MGTPIFGILHSTLASLCPQYGVVRVANRLAKQFSILRLASQPQPPMEAQTHEWHQDRPHRAVTRSALGSPPRVYHEDLGRNHAQAERRRGKIS